MTQTLTATGVQRIGLRLDPLDALFFRGGRSMETGSRASSGLPTPQTLAGAVRTHLLRQHGCDFARLGRCMKGGASFEEAVRESCDAAWIAQVRVRGPWLARKKDGRLEVLVRAPATLYEEKTGEAKKDTKKRWQLQPLSDNLPGWRPGQEGMKPLWTRESSQGKRVDAFLSPDGLEAFLRGEIPEKGSTVPSSELYALDHRTCVGISPDTLTSEESLLFSPALLALKANVTFYAELDLPAEADAFAEPTTIRFGGESKHVAARAVQPFAWPDATPNGSGRVLVMLTTPAIFDNGWRPAQWPAGLRLVAAAVPGHQPVSGWDLARGGPKPNRFAAQAGSVYFLEGDVAEWPDSLTDRDDDKPLGWGCFVKGVWNYV